MITPVTEHFTSELQPRWTRTIIGAGVLEIVDGRLRMLLPPTAEGEYADAQIDDYGTLPRTHFPWRPPLHMEVRARSSLPANVAGQVESSTTLLRGKAGFGFWNYPFSVRGDVLMLPEAVWFFYASPPSNMALVPGSAGWGWKAQVVHAMRPGALLATVPTALSVGWGRLTKNTQPAGRWLQRLSGTHEQLLDVEMSTWHNYTLEWRATEANFWVDGRHVLRAPHPPTRPLGFVAWLDNQYAIVTPGGQLRFGAVGCEEQWFELDSITIDPLQ